MNFNPRTSYEVRRIQHTRLEFLLLISIHAPLTRCDGKQATIPALWIISIHAPLTRCDFNGSAFYANCCANFNPRTSYEVRRASKQMTVTAEPDFNPRTSYEVRLEIGTWGIWLLEFQSTHLLRGATYSEKAYNYYNRISIHAPLTRCDLFQQKMSMLTENFNPRTSYEVRPEIAPSLFRFFSFQSTHLLRGATP